MATNVAQLLVAITADTKGLNAGLASASKSTAAFGATASALGTAAVVGIAAAGVAAVKLATDFDKSFTRIAAISNTSASAIEGMKEQVLTLAGETAQSPVELADALFFLASAGLDASEVMPALEASAMASAVGLGETADVANIVASVLNAYSDSAMQATDVTDALVAAVREGRAEPEEFANALGRILPIASTVGVSFDQLAASMASLSNIGLDVNEATTAMRGVLQALAAPGKQAADAMAAIGLSAQDMLDAISEKGIIGALRMLDEAAKSQTDTQAEYNGVLREIIPNVRALTAVFGLTVQEAEKVDAIFQRVLNSTGDTSEAFKTTAESDAFKLQKAMNDLVVVATQLGTTALPLLADIAGVLASNIDVVIAGFTAWIVVTKLLPGLLNLIRVSMFNVATGTGALSKAAAAASITIRGMTVALSTLSTVLTAGVAAALLIIPGLIQNASISLDKLAKDTKFTTGFLSDLDTQFSLFGRVRQDPSFTNIVTSLDFSLSGLISTFNGTRDQVTQLTEILVPLYQNLQTLGLTAFQSEAYIRTFTDALTEGTAAGFAEVEAAIQENIVLITALGQSLGRGAIDLGIFTDRMLGLGFSSTEALALADGALDQFGRSVNKNGKIVKNWASLSDEEFAKFKEDVVESLQVTIGQFESFNDAFSETPKELQRALNTAVRIARQELRDVREILAADLTPAVEHALLGLEPAYRHAWATAGAAGKKQAEQDALELERVTGRGAEAAAAAIGRAVPKQTDPVEITVDAAPGFRIIDGLKSSLHAIPDEEVIIHVKTIGGSTGFDLIDHLEARLHEVTEPDWQTTIGVNAPDLEGDALVGAGAPAGSGKNVAVVLDRRRFTDTTDYDARYRGF